MSKIMTYKQMSSIISDMDEYSERARALLMRYSNNVDENNIINEIDADYFLKDLMQLINSLDYAKNSLSE